MIVFTSVAKQFPNGSIGLSDITLEIPQGQFVFIIGPSGAGKTTLMKLLTRELSPSQGSIRFGEFEIGKLPRRKVSRLRRTIGVIFQDLKLLMDRTVFENVALTLEVLKVPKAEIKERVVDTLQRVGLAEKAQFFPIQLSGGEAQRTAFARATVHNPQVVLADEPTADLDPKNALTLLEFLDTLHRGGTTVVMATHNANLVNEFKKRVVVLEHGKIMADHKEGTYAL